MEETNPPIAVPDLNRARARGVQVLVAEDYPVNQKIVVMLLQNAGYHVDLVDNGQTAVNAYQQGAYDLILMDLEMPTLDGLQAASLIRDMEKQANALIDCGRERVPIIALTGHGSPQEDLAPLFDDCIAKPLQREDLLFKVRCWIEKSQIPPPDKPQRPTGTQPSNSELDLDVPMNLEKVLDEFLGNRAVLRDVLRVFSDQIHQQVERMRQALSQGDFEVVRAQAHAIKGGAANLTAERLTNLASRIEFAAAQADSGDIGYLLNDLEGEIARIEIYSTRHFLKDEDPYS
jgi:two-component system sensor histidine kinase/response regulator